jgi:hypothetical protein
VRREDDPGSGPALPIHIEADAQLKGPPGVLKQPPAKSKGGPSRREEGVKRVLAGSTCKDEKRVRQARAQLCSRLLVSAGTMESCCLSVLV